MRDEAKRPSGQHPAARLLQRGCKAENHAAKNRKQHSEADYSEVEVNFVEIRNICRSNGDENTQQTLCQRASRYRSCD